MFRKSALDLVIPEPGRPIETHMATDGYFIPLLHLMTGSALISQRLFAYRVHGDNHFSAAPMLRGIRTQRKALMTVERHIFCLRTLMTRAESFDWILAGDRFLASVDLLAGFDGIPPTQYFRQDAVQEILVEAWHPLLATFGRDKLLSELRAHMDENDLQRVVSRVYRGSFQREGGTTNATFVRKLSRRCASIFATSPLDDSELREQRDATFMATGFAPTRPKTLRE